MVQKLIVMIYIGSLRTKFRTENIYLGILILKAFIYSVIQSIINRNYIYVVGDSHVFSFTNLQYKISYLGPVTAYNLCNNNSKTKGRSRLFNEIAKFKKNSLVILVFGEIDTRIHIYNQYMLRNKSDSINQLIANTVANYIKAIKDLKSESVRLAIFNIVPPGEQENIYNYPFYADRNTRLEITKELNSQLEHWCKKENILFINIYNNLVNKDNSRKKELILDRTHYNNKISDLVSDFLNRNGIQP